jgi:hypothetical protein
LGLAEPGTRWNRNRQKKIVTQSTARHDGTPAK